MVAEIVVPKLGVSTELLQLMEWKVTEGDRVEKGSVVPSVEADKINFDIEAQVSGFVHILFEVGSEVSTGSVAGLIADTKEGLAKIQAKVVEAKTPLAKSKELTKERKGKAPSIVQSNGERIRISPVARRLAEESGIDISKLLGTGPSGRIIKEDVEKAIEAVKTTEKAAAASPSGAPAEVYEGKRTKVSIPLMGMRKAIAEHMHRSLSLSAQVTLMGELDMTEMVKLRESLLREEEVLGTRISYTDLMVFVTAKVIGEYPTINSSLVGNEIKVWEDINIGVAVALEEGLIVPVVKNADQKSLVEISKAVKSLAGKARAGTLTPDEAKGGTFTITNLGALGGGYRFETPIINQPESAILGIGGITDRPVVRDGQIVIRPVMTYYLTYDHRVIDGAVAARFTASLVRLLENPAL